MNNKLNTDSLRASNDGHTFHARWAARKALQLVFPNDKDDLFAIAVEGLSTTETADPGDEAFEIADLVLYFGEGDTFEKCRSLQTIQFKYKANIEPETASYLKKTLQKFAGTLLGYETEFSQEDVKAKLTFSIVTNTSFSEFLWEAIKCFNEGTQPKNKNVLQQYTYLEEWCQDKGVSASRLIPLIEFQTLTKDLPAQNRALQRILGDWTPGVDSLAKMRLFGLVELIREKAGLKGQHNNLVKREDVLDSLGCEPEDLFPANTEFIDVGTIVKREALNEAKLKILNSQLPVYIYADGGVGKTVFIQSLASYMSPDFETVVFDCFGGGSYRAEDLSRHLPRVGLLQIVNELASRGLCDPQLPSDGDRATMVNAARKRLIQAANTVKSQSEKAGVLVIIDAADNAQFEANNRNEDAFPKLLLANLSRDPVDGVKLVLTSRPHRRNDVIGKSPVNLFELGPFTESETHEFLKSRRIEFTELQFKTAFSRSEGNARVLDYLIANWDENIANTKSVERITVEALISERCNKIRSDLHIAGWEDEEVKQFFVAISLLPPPIPLDEMAKALDWELSKIRSAVSDLAPMLELLKHGVIFRDEPTETFIRETYVSEKIAQEQIADRLISHQVDSEYAAEALPHFLVVINDSNRAYELANSNEYPVTIHSAYSKRRLKLSRLHAAFKLAVKEKDNDRALKISMHLAQVASANAKGNEFIRKLPGLSVSLGDRDASRRLFEDRSGWRGARDCRLTVAFAFQNEFDEAAIHQNRAIQWLNWFYQNLKDETHYFHGAGPSESDLAHIIFLNLLNEDYSLVELNLSGFGSKFAISVISECFGLVEQYEKVHSVSLITKIANFAASKNSKSIEFQLTLLANRLSLNRGELNLIAKNARHTILNSPQLFTDSGFDEKNIQKGIVCNAALSALINSTRQSAAVILGSINHQRPSRYDFQERYGPFRGWWNFLSAFIKAWSKGNRLNFVDLLPKEIQINKEVKKIKDLTTLSKYLGTLTKASDTSRKKAGKKESEKLFSIGDCENIVSGIKLILELVQPLETTILERKEVDDTLILQFLKFWESKLTNSNYSVYQEYRDVLIRAVGLEIIKVLLKHASVVSAENCTLLINLLKTGKFYLPDKFEILSLVSRHSNLKEQTGKFATNISEIILKDESIDARANQYSLLSKTLLNLSLGEAQFYFREGLAQLDQIGGDDYKIVYSLLEYASIQRGGFLEPNISHRLMNLCQMTFHDEPSKFGWTIFGQVVANSIGLQALYKLIRWEDQDVAELSYGLPQAVCFLAKAGHLEARRAAYLLSICRDPGGWSWEVSDGLRDILEVAKTEDRPKIFKVIFESLKINNPSNSSEKLWYSLRELAEKYPEINDLEIKSYLNSFDINLDENEANWVNNIPHNNKDLLINAESEAAESAKASDELFLKIRNNCNITSSESVDSAIQSLNNDKRIRFKSGNRLIEQLRDSCQYEQRYNFLVLLTELHEVDFDDSINFIIECVEQWSDSSAHIMSNKKMFIQRIFENRGSDLFSLEYKNLPSQLKKIVDFCGDPKFVLELMLVTLTKEKIELSGEEWIQVATSICPYASTQANLEGLEIILNNSATIFVDEFGEGPFKAEYLIPENESSLVAEIAWHLLGNAHSFTRWPIARSIEYLCELGLIEELSHLIELVSCQKTQGLKSKSMDYSWLNSAQWLFMGLSRASNWHKSTLALMKDQIEKLLKSDSIHVINKIHILRYLINVTDCESSKESLKNKYESIFFPKMGYKLGNSWSLEGKRTTSFNFDYEFNKNVIPSLARLFGITDGEAADLISKEIQERWPDANNMDYFGGHDRFRSNSQLYESNRDSVQRHGLLFAATSLIEKLPVIRSKYESDYDQWIEWVQQYDSSSSSGLWLADHKDEDPDFARETLITKVSKSEALESDERLLRKIGLLEISTEQFVPVYGAWKTPDNVHVSIEAGLAPLKAIVATCSAFSKKNSIYDLWLPRFGYGGKPDPSNQTSLFTPLIWQPEIHSVGVDSEDEYAVKQVAQRPSLGVELTQSLNLHSTDNGRHWLNQDLESVLENRVWGKWRRDSEERNHWSQDEGYILSAKQDWLPGALKSLDKALVVRVIFHRYGSSQRYNEKLPLKAAFVGLYQAGKGYRFWKAKKASKTSTEDW